MSDEPAKPEGEEAAPPRAPLPKLVLILLVLNLGASGFSVFKQVTTHPPVCGPSAAGGEHGSGSAAAPTTAEITGPIVELEPFVVNLDEQGSSRYLRTKVQLEVADKAAEGTVTKSVLLVRDVILAHLSGLKLADTLGAQAKEKVRTELIEKLGKELGAGKVRRMFFTEWVVQ